MISKSLKTKTQPSKFGLSDVEIAIFATIFIMSMIFMYAIMYAGISTNLI